MTGLGRGRSKLVATWLAVLGGGLGLHRFYLHGVRDPWGWLHVPPTLIGAYGFWRMRTLGTDDRLGSLLVPWLGASLAAAMLAALVYGLMPDDRWNAGFGRGGPAGRAGWGIVFGVVVALALGATVTMATIAFTAQRWFESQGPG